MSVDFEEMAETTGAGPTTLSVIERESIDVQIATAKRYPRSITRAKQRMIDMATLDEDTAKGCFYTLRRKNADGGMNLIEGPSARLAEIVTSCWGNVRAGARTIGEDEKFVTCQGVCHDMETNVHVSIEVKRRITGRSGRKYGDDMIATTSNAGNSIAYRNAVFKVVPKAVWQPAYEHAKLAAVGDVKSIAQRRQNCVAAFGKMHVTPAQLMEVLGKADGAGVDDIGGDDLLKLQGLFNAIRDGETTVDEVFNSKPAVENGGKRPFGPPATVPHPTGEGQTIDTRDSNLPTEEAERVIANAPRAPQQQPPQDEQKEVDVSGADAEPAKDDLKTESLFVEAAKAIAKTQNVPDAVFDEAIKKLRVSDGIGGGRLKDTTRRNYLRDAMQAGAFDWSLAKISE